MSGLELPTLIHFLHQISEVDAPAMFAYSLTTLVTAVSLNSLATFDASRMDSPVASSGPFQVPSAQKTTVLATVITYCKSG